MYDAELLSAEVPPGNRGDFPSFARIVAGRRSQREPSKDLVRRLTEVGGLNRFNDPNFRIVWGWKPTEYIYSRHNRTYELRPRYVPQKRDRWFLEQWFPPEKYGTPWMWRHQYTENIDGREVDLLGPFPERGAYEQLITIETWHANGCETPRENDCKCGGMRYMELTPWAIEEIVDRVRAARLLNPWARREKTWNYIEDQHEQFDAHADDVIKDLQPAFDLRPHAFLGHKWTGEVK